MTNRYSANQRAKRAERLARHLAEKAKTRKPWERDDELDTAESWPFFMAFRDAKGSRRLERVRHALDERGVRPGGAMPTLEQVRRWHDEGCWRERVAAYDDYMESIRQEEEEATLRKGAAERQAGRLAISDTLKEAIQKEADKLAAKVDAMDGEVLKPAELLKAVEIVHKIERLEMGESTENTHTELDLSGLSPEALAELRKAVEDEK